MKTTTTVSRDIIDKRKHAAAGPFGGVLVTLFAVLGVRWFATGSPQDPDRDLVYLVSTALDRAQTYWADHIPTYQRAHVLLYEQGTDTACGYGLETAGPFWCEADQRVYVSLGFLRAIHGDLARAYVLFHELGHHVEGLRGQLGGSSVHVELLADCYAGQVAASERDAGRLDVSDIPGALAEAAAVGDDKLCPSCSLDRYTHGTAAQRVAAFSAGLDRRDCPSSVPQ